MDERIDRHGGNVSCSMISTTPFTTVTREYQKLAQENVQRGLHEVNRRKKRLKR